MTWNAAFMTAMDFDLHGTSLGDVVDKPTSSASLDGFRMVEG
jgi:hypothetical protein